MSPLRKSFRATIVGLALASGLAVGLGATPVMAASGPDQSTSEQSVSHSGKGTSVLLTNNSGQSIKLGDEVIPNGKVGSLYGKNGDGDDVSTTISDESGKQVRLYGHNPRWSEAYLQFEGTKVFDTSIIQSGGMTFRVQWIGDNGDYKVWTVTALGQQRYAHEHIHGTDNADGVKGTVTNKSSWETIVRLGGKDLRLKPGQSLLFFDAKGYSGGQGIDMGIFGGDTEDNPAYMITAKDPVAWYPSVEVTDEHGVQRDSHNFSEGESRAYNWGGFGDLDITVTREKDGRMEVPYETSDTSDWAWFSINIVDSKY